MNALNPTLASVCVVIAAVLPGTAKGVGIGVLDQEYDVTNSTTAYGFYGEWQPAQVFTAGVRGQLSRIEVKVNRRLGDRNPLVLSILDTSDSAPNRVLASFSLPYDRVTAVYPTWCWPSFDVSSAHLEVSRGDQLAIALATLEGSNYHWSVSPSGGPSGLLYPDGEAFYRTPYTGGLWREDPAYSRCFRTYVIPVPEPSTFVLLAMGAVAIVSARLGRRRLT